MMASFRTWLLGIVLTAFASGLARQLVPAGKSQMVVRLVSGLLLVLSFLRPLASIPWEESSIAVGNFYENARQLTEQYRESGEKELSAIIERKTASYIWDKATELGLECTVSVDVAVTESGVPLPHSVTITAFRSQALAKWLEEVVGIPAEKQIWLEGSS